jgi:hypothetical protein
MHELHDWCPFDGATANEAALYTEPDPFTPLSIRKMWMSLVGAVHHNRVESYINHEEILMHRAL